MSLTESSKTTVWCPSVCHSICLFHMKTSLKIALDCKAA